MSDHADIEFSRPVNIRRLDAKAHELVATADECAALAARFGLVAVRSLSAELALEPDGAAVLAKGWMRAAIVQSCAISGDDLPVDLDESLALTFVPARDDYRPDEEIELAAEELDEIEFEGERIDLGEAVAQTLALAIDPFACGPEANRVRAEQGLDEPAATGPFAGLAALKENDSYK